MTSENGASANAAPPPAQGVDRYAVNDALTQLFARFGVSDDPEREGWDDYLNDLTHSIADRIDATSAPSNTRL